MADLRVFCVLALVSLSVGLVVNRGRRQPLPLIYHTKEERLRTAVAGLRTVEAGTPTGQAREIGLEEFQAFALSRKGVVIDARPALIYGLGHVPGAVNLSRENFDADYRRLEGTLGTRKADPVAVYCSGADCQDGNLVAGALRALGYQRLLTYPEGWEEWSQSGLPQEK